MPLGIGFGISISLQSGIPAPTYFEIEGGFVGCASRIMVKQKTDEAAPGAAGDTPKSSSPALGVPLDNYRRPGRQPALGDIPGLAGTDD